MDLIKKLEDLSVRYTVVSELIGGASLIKDQKKYKVYETRIYYR